MKKIFIEEHYGLWDRYYTISTLDNLRIDCGCLHTVNKELLKLRDNYTVCVFDIEKGMYNLLCEEFSLNPYFNVHIYSVLSPDEVRIMRKEQLTLVGYWKYYKMKN